MSWDQESDAYWLSHPGTRHTSPILHSDFRGKVFSLKLLSMMFVVAFQIMLRQFYSWFVEWFGFCFFVCLFICFFVMKVLNFVRFILCISWNGFAVFFFILLMRCLTLIGFLVLNHPCIQGINLTWLWYTIFVICCWIWFTSIMLRVFTKVFIRDTGL